VADFIGSAVGDEEAEGLEGALLVMDIEFLNGHGQILPSEL
jgi:hypothetical protein